MQYFPKTALLLGLVVLWSWPVQAQTPKAEQPKVQTPHAESDLAANAAVQYWQAFAQMPALDKEQEKILAQWNTVSLDDPAVQKLIADSHPSLLYLHRGAKLERCDWGLDYGDGISLLLPHLAKSRDLARLAVLRGRHNFERGNKRAARDDATAIMALARHVGRDPIMICVLVRFGIEGQVVDLVAPYVPEIKAGHTQAAAMFEGMPKAPSVKETLPVEKKYFVEWMIGKLKEEEKREPGAGLKLWKNFLMGSDVPDAVKDVATVDEAARLIAEILPVYDDLAKLAALPKEEFDAQYPEFKQKTKAARPLAGVIVPAVDELLAKERRNDVRLAMLLAATAVAESGPEKLKEFKDPFGDGPFEYRALDQGFELKSKLQYDDKPVTLTVGRRSQD
jgi:hypothetical protein